MKFLRNTATDFFAHSARFIKFDQGDPCDSCDKQEASTGQQEQKTVIEKNRSDLTQLANDCIPKTGLWSTATQNERAKTMTVNANKQHPVSYGDTLGSIVKGITGRLDYGRPVLYRSKKLTPSKIAQWNKTNTCFPIPNNLGQTEQAFDLRVVNAIYPGQIVYIEEINGVKYVVVDDGGSGSTGRGSGSISGGGTSGYVPGNGETQTEKENCRDNIQTPTIKPDCENNKCDYDFSAIWNGARAEDGTSLSLLQEITGVEDAEKAMDAYVKLYGQKEWVGVDQDGVYTVLEKHYNPKAGVPLWSSLKEIFTDVSLEKTFQKAGYSNATELAATFTGKVLEENGGADMESLQKTMETNATNFSKKAGDRNSGATKEVLLRVATGAAVAIGMAAALGTPISAAVALAGLPLLKFRTGIKRFDPTASVNAIWAVFSNPSATQEDFDKFSEDVDFSNTTAENTSYIDLQKNSVESTRKTTIGMNSVASQNAVFKHGPGKNPPEGITLTEDEKARYAEHAKNITVVGDKAEKMLDQLALNGYYFEEGAAFESDYAKRAEKFKLRGNNKKNFDKNMKLATSSLVWKTSEDNYEFAMDRLVTEFNNVASEELYGKLEKEEKHTPRSNSIDLINLKLTDLANALSNGGEFYLGRLPNAEGINRKLYVKFVPSVADQDKETAAAGEWMMYIEDTDKNGTGSTRPISYTEVISLVGKKSKKLETEDISTLGFDPDNLLTSPKEKKSLIKKLNFFNLMVGQMNQINEAKDQMLLSALNKRGFQEIVEIENRLQIGLRCKGTKTETQEQYQYRVAVGAKFALFLDSKNDPNGFKKFKEGLSGYEEIAFSPEIMKEIEKVFNREHGALDQLVLNTKFQKEMSILSQNMECINNYLTLDDLDACAAYAKRNTFVSGWTAMRQSKNHTVSVGEAYLLYSGISAVLPREITETITSDYWHNMFTGDAVKAEMGWIPDGAGWILEPGTKEISKTIIQWQVKGWLDEAAIKAIILISGGVITQEVISNILNKPEN